MEMHFIAELLVATFVVRRHHIEAAANQWDKRCAVAVIAASGELDRLRLAIDKRAEVGKYLAGETWRHSYHCHVC